jgi:hypothetical protein
MRPSVHEELVGGADEALRAPIAEPAVARAAEASPKIDDPALWARDPAVVDSQVREARRATTVDFSDPHESPFAGIVS